MRHLELLKIRREETIASAFKRLAANSSGVLFVTDENERVLGAVSDGDIRRHLQSEDDTESSITRCMNGDLVSVPLGTSRETVLKLLDHRIRILPLLDDLGRLHDVYTRERFRLETERAIVAQGRAPARISFGGGGTDLTRHFVEHGSVVMNATISQFSRACLRKTRDGRVRIRSHDLHAGLEADNIYDLAFDGKLDLIVSVIKLIEPSFGFELQIGSDYPPGSGLGGSAVVAAAVIGCFNELREDQWDRHQIAEMAFQAERLQLNIPGGWQDQYATVFGGFNLLEFTRDHNTVLPLRIQADTIRELEASLLLCYTGMTRNSGDMHRRQQASESGLCSFAEDSRRLTLEMKRVLLRGRLRSYGHLLHESWLVKKHYSPHASSPEIDGIYETALENGALGGRLLGAGGGGYFLFFVEPFLRYRLTAALNARGLTTREVVFDKAGLQSWCVRAS